MRRALAFPVYRLEADDYSAPRGSLCLIEGELSDQRAAVHWLPPLSGGSLPIHLADLEEAGELILPLDFVLAAIADG